ncbi:MAG: hypothetical protein QGH39_06725 [Candidatus Thermoplasmatota archaeon]|jgi:hypothetical protein|nr:hypothetical protein [Candidatus Thermoplasmatota archaeon]MDP7265237.1 hypothetical protein [Candidatus Thermoplasmatota archaeon]
MPKKDCLIALRITAEAQKALRKIMVNDGEEKLSETLRSALDEYIERRLPKTENKNAVETRELMLRLNERAYMLLRRLVEDGIINSIAEGIREAIPAYARNKMGEYKEIEDAFKLESDRKERRVKETRNNSFDGFL